MASEPVGLLLAAGLGTRYDPTGSTLKLLAPARRGPHAGAPMAAAAARSMLAAIARVTAVVRPAESEVQRRLHGLLRSEGCILAICDDADVGMSASIVRGVQAEGGAAGWVIGLADMPAIEATTVRAVVGLLLDGALTAAPTFRGQRGHPVGFAAPLLPELLALAGDTGARSVLARHPPQLIEVDDPGVLYDVDTPEDR
jgi:molybdenum cofactor cytidylyltransferase